MSQNPYSATLKLTSLHLSFISWQVGEIPLHTIIGEFFLIVRNDSQTCFLESASLLIILQGLLGELKVVPHEFFHWSRSVCLYPVHGVPERSSLYELGAGNDSNLWCVHIWHKHAVRWYLLLFKHDLCWWSSFSCPMASESRAVSPMGIPSLPLFFLITMCTN